MPTSTQPKNKADEHKEESMLSSSTEGFPLILRCSFLILLHDFWLLKRWNSLSNLKQSLVLAINWVIADNTVLIQFSYTSNS